MIMELGRKKVRLGELLVNSGVLSNEQLQQALDNPARQGKKLGEFLVMKASYRRMTWRRH